MMHMSICSLESVFSQRKKVFKAFLFNWLTLGYDCEGFLRSSNKIEYVCEK